MSCCTNCGAKLPENANFCNICGASREGTAVRTEQRSGVYNTVPTPTQNVAPPKKRKTALWVILGILGTVLLLCAAATIVFLVRGESDNSQELGVYTAVSAEIDETQLDVDTMYPDGFSITLSRAGSCSFRVGNDSGRGKWTLDGVLLHVQGGGLDCDGMLSDGVMILYDVLDTGIDMTLTLDGVNIPAEPQATAETEGEAPTQSSTEQPTEAVQFWNGSWYGWWIIDEATGEYAGLDDGSGWWDCCALIELSADGSGLLTLWDEDSTRVEALAVVNVQLNEGITQNGCLTSTSGTFYDCRFGAGDWSIDPGTERYDNLISFSGTYVDPNDENNGFTYSVHLRPWGTDWSDLAQEDEGYLPYYYENWYLPLIEAGAQMPDTIG